MACTTCFKPACDICQRLRHGTKEMGNCLSIKVDHGRAAWVRKRRQRPHAVRQQSPYPSHGDGTVYSEALPKAKARRRRRRRGQVSDEDVNHTYLCAGFAIRLPDLLPAARQRTAGQHASTTTSVANDAGPRHVHQPSSSAASADAGTRYAHTNASATSTDAGPRYADPSSSATSTDAGPRHAHPPSSSTTSTDAASSKPAVCLRHGPRRRKSFVVEHVSGMPPSKSWFMLGVADFKGVFSSTSSVYEAGI